MKRELVNVAGHTIDERSIDKGCIIDVGCRGWEFTNYFVSHFALMRTKIYCIDPDEQVFIDGMVDNYVRPNSENFVFLNVAIADKKGDAFFYRNGEMSVLCDLYQPLPHLYTPCKTITMDDLYEITGTDVDILKIDAEGAEVYILGDGFKPIPKQITVEFHRHTLPELYEKNIDKMMNNLLRDYELVYQHETMMDNLFIRKDILNGN